jgi:hypothetical protein
MYIYLFTEWFHSDENDEFLRTPVNSISLFLFQHLEASKGAAAEQMGSPLGSVIMFMFKYPLIPELRNCDSLTLGNLISIGSNQ